ncbi:hypothetical protein A3Q56_07087 [Intoshia linei]|uniref:Dynein regulatory complex protein 1 C-terminal domain-containing protein n=1 Tax=Intoshia linei TaxID=1819745 RepID=A0A177ATA1_9BILA|nr:hypothetical protein A3Q56_07087 [Intoshia linei]
MNESPEYEISGEMKDYVDMQNFWMRYNRVLLEKVALEKEKSVKIQENGNLRSLLKQYLEGISVNSDILSKENPLLIINNKQK